MRSLRRNQRETRLRRRRDEIKENQPACGQQSTVQQMQRGFYPSTLLDHLFYYHIHLTFNSDTINKIQAGQLSIERPYMYNARGWQLMFDLFSTSSPSQDGWLSTLSTALALKNKEVRPCRANAVHVVGSLLVPQRGDDSARRQHPN